MGKSSRRFWLERLESRCLLAALGPDAQGLESFDPLSTVPGRWQEGSAAIESSEMQGMRGAALEVSFDQTRLQVEPRDVRAGTAWGGKGLAVANVDNIEGKINIFIFSAQKTQREQGSLVEIDFRRSDGDSDNDLPLIDVDRLRINDQETSWEVSDRTNGSLDNLHVPSKLSMQFNITAEGELPIVTDGVVDGTIDSSASHTSARNLSDPGAIGGQDNVKPIREEAIEPSPLIALETQKVCVPGEIHSSPNELAINQLDLEILELQGPIKLPKAQDLNMHFFAAINSNAGRAMTSPPSYAERFTSQTTNRVADFPLLPMKSSLFIESSSELLPKDTPVTALADEVFSKTDFHAELSALDSR